MIIELRRAMTDEDAAQRVICGVCRGAFTTESIVAVAKTDDACDMGRACPECLDLLGSGYPWRFPKLSQYEEALERYPEPVTTAEALRRGSREEEDKAYEKTFIDLS